MTRQTREREPDTAVTTPARTTPPPPLAGYTVAVTADRRRDELTALLERRGARVVLAPALRIMPLADDTQLHEATREVLDRPPDIVIANTGIGMRGWLEAAEGWGLAEPLRTVLANSYLVTRGPKARGALRAAGLTDDWTPASECGTEVLEHLQIRGLAGRRVALQLHGEAQPEHLAALRAAGAEVVEIPVYRWAPPSDLAPLHRLVDLIAHRLVDAVTFTSAPAVTALLRAAGPASETIVEALRDEVLAACVGPVTAEPLHRHGVPTVSPTRARLGALVRNIVDELPKRAVTLRIDKHELVLRGHAALVDGELRPLAPAPMAVLRALANAPGRVLSRAALLRTLPRGADEHAVEMAVARLRAGLGTPRIVQTVVKRGYRLRVD